MDTTGNESIAFRRAISSASRLSTQTSCIRPAEVMARDERKRKGRMRTQGREDEVMAVWVSFGSSSPELATSTLLQPINFQTWLSSTHYSPGCLWPSSFMVSPPR